MLNRRGTGYGSSSGNGMWLPVICTTNTGGSEIVDDGLMATLYQLETQILMIK